METKPQKQTRPQFTNHHELRTDVGLDCSIEAGGGGADQSFKKQCDINVIMKQYENTGMLPQQTHIQPRYIDNTEVPTLEEAFEATNRAMEAFYDLPPEVRRLMDNDPSKLENFIADSENHQVLEKYGIIVKTPIEKHDATNQDIVDALNKLKEPKKLTE